MSGQALEELGRVVRTPVPPRSTEPTAHPAGSALLRCFFSGLLRPKRHILGTELAGEIEAVELIESGNYRAVIRRYRLEDVVEATRYVETQQKTGNVVPTVGTPAARAPHPTEHMS